jgi:hypothetical protein
MDTRDAPQDHRSFEGSTRDAGVDGSGDGPHDAPLEAQATEGRAFDSGCGPLDTTMNCSACGKTCAAVSSSVTMVSCPGQPNGAGSTCQYMCATGYLDCNAATDPPDLDGCECKVTATATPSDCCSGGCPVLHKDNGFGKSYYECSSSPQQVALAACASFTSNRAQCSSAPCTWDDGGLTGDSVVCSFGSTTDCVCWDYAGPDANFVHDSGSSGTCVCPDAATDPPYN